MPHKALFLDRDGIINIDHGYVSRPEDFEFSPGIFTLLKLFQKAGYLLFIITNQSGIGRGYYSEKQFLTLTQWMTEKLEKERIHIEKVYYCPHLPDSGCDCRKPNPGMIKKAAKTYDIDLGHSWMIGDKESDIQLAHNAGIGRCIYIGEHVPEGSTIAFPSVEACTSYFQENQDKIP